MILTGNLYLGGYGDASLTKTPGMGDNIVNLVENYSNFTDSYGKDGLRTHIYQDGIVTYTYSTLITGNGNRYCILPCKSSSGDSVYYYMTVDYNNNITSILNTDALSVLSGFYNGFEIGYDCYYGNNNRTIYRIDADTLETTDLGITLSSSIYNSNKSHII